MITLDTYLLFFFEMFVFYLVLKSVLFYRMFKINPVKFLKVKNWREFLVWQGMMMVLVGFGVLVVLTFSGYDTGLKFTLLNHYMFNFLGVALTIIGFVMMVMAHQQMGKAWRMGVDEKQRNTLVSQGLYSISRNPIYVAILFQALGLVLLLKTALSLGLFIVLYISIYYVIKIEEIFLLQIFEERYTEYKKKVRRFF